MKKLLAHVERTGPNYSECGLRVQANMNEEIIFSGIHQNESEEVKEDLKNSVKTMIGVEVHPLLATDDVETFLSNLFQETNPVKTNQESSAAATSHRQNDKTIQGGPKLG